MSSTRRDRVFRASEHGEPSWEVLQFAPPSVWLDVFRRARNSFDCIDACEGMRAPDAPFLALSCALRQTGVFDGAASVMESVRNVLRPPKPRDPCGMSNRPRFARAPPASSCPQGFRCVRTWSP